MKHSSLFSVFKTMPLYLLKRHYTRTYTSERGELTLEQIHEYRQGCGSSLLIKKKKKKKNPEVFLFQMWWDRYGGGIDMALGAPSCYGSWYCGVYVEHACLSSVDSACHRYVVLIIHSYH